MAVMVFTGTHPDPLHVGDADPGKLPAVGEVPDQLPTGLRAADLPVLRLEWATSGIVLKRTIACDSCCAFVLFRYIEVILTRR